MQKGRERESKRQTSDKNEVEDRENEPMSDYETERTRRERGEGKMERCIRKRGIAEQETTK